MKITKCLRLSSILLGLAAFSVSSMAYAENDEDKKCRKPKFREFEPAHLSEVDPETEIAFHVSNWANPESITAEAKKVPMKVEVVDKMNFFVATAKLPAELKGTYARIHITAKAEDGGCFNQDGWLLKIKDAPGEAKAAAAKTGAETGDVKAEPAPSAAEEGAK